jgi:hypothetical protein
MPNVVGVCALVPLPPLDWSVSGQVRHQTQDKHDQQAETQAGYQAEAERCKPMITLQLRVDIIDLI